MGIIDYIEKMQKKPAAKRKRFALVFSGCFTAIVFAVWVTVLFPHDIGRLMQERNANSDDPALKDQFDSVFGDFSNNYQAMRKDVAEASETFAAAALALSNASSTATTSAGMMLGSGTTTESGSTQTDYPLQGGGQTGSPGPNASTTPPAEGQNGL